MLFSLQKNNIPESEEWKPLFEQVLNIPEKVKKFLFLLARKYTVKRLQISQIFKSTL